MKNHKNFYLSATFLITFAFWTIAVTFIDVQPIGPNGSHVGFATVNRFFHNLTGTNMTLYTITDWLGLVPIAFCLGFAVIGLYQFIKRKSLLKVDYDVLLLGVFYIVTITVYLLFEEVVINYRPILINGFLESSYPSSTTLLVLCVMPTSTMQLNERIKSKLIKICAKIFIVVFVAFMVFGRLLSGVHWLTDIIGGALFSIGLVLMYSAVTKHLPLSEDKGDVLFDEQLDFRTDLFNRYHIKHIISVLVTLLLDCEFDGGFVFK